MIDLSLAEIRALSEVASSRSFRQAATRLDISPSALSHTVAAIEARIGLRFFNRTTRSVALTEGGATFLRRVGPQVLEIEAAIAEAQGARTKPGGLLRINGSEGGLALLMPLVAPFLRRHPAVELDLVVDGGLSDIVALGFDAGLRSADLVPRDMIAVPVGPDLRFVVVGAPSYLADHPAPKTPGDLVRHQCLRARLPNGRSIAWDFERQGRDVTVPVDGKLILGSPALAQMAACDGLGLAYVAMHEAAGDLEAGRLVQVLADWTPAYPGLRLYYPRHPIHGVTLQAFAEHLRAAHRRDAARAKAPTPGRSR